MNIFKLWFSTLIFTLLSVISNGQDNFLTILIDELNREMTEFKKSDNPPYYLAYRVNDQFSSTISSSFGTIISLDTTRRRMLNTVVRVGDYSKDNTHALNNGNFMGRGFNSFVSLPLDDNKNAIAQELWRNTDRTYKMALDAFNSSRFSDENSKNDTLPDFTIENAETYFQEEQSECKLEIDIWNDRLNLLTEKFNSNLNIINGDATIRTIVDHKYFVSSEGAKIKQTNTFSYLHINGIIRATDGMICPLVLSYFGFTPDELPSMEKLLSDVDGLIERLKKLRNAPLAEPYEGPAILSPKASGVFFHEIFGHRVEGHRTRQKTDSQTFNEKVGERVLPKAFNVTFDPTMDKFEDYSLSGYYMFDDEGIKGQKVEVVSNGVLNEYLQSRCPITTNSRSNGHGRAQAGMSTVTRQSNMLVQADKNYSMDKLRKQLIKACKKQNKPYGYLFEEVSGGFTTVSRFMPNAFNVNPLEVYRVFTDGRPDELVRGVSLIGTPLAMFAEIKSAGDQFDIFNGFCGAESGAVPVSTVAPALFVNQIETQKKMNIESSETILNRPGIKQSSKTN